MDYDMQAWNVYLNGRNIDKVFFVEDMSAEDVKRSLVNHDGYHQDIFVKKEAR